MFEPDDDRVLFDGRSVPFEVRRVRTEVSEQGERASAAGRSTFTVRGTDGLFLQVSWDPARSAEHVWMECSYDAGLVSLDRPDRWAAVSRTNRSPGERRCRYTPQLLSSRVVYEILAAATNTAA